MKTMTIEYGVGVGALIDAIWSSIHRIQALTHNIKGDEITIVVPEMVSRWMFMEGQKEMGSPMQISETDGRYRLDRLFGFKCQLGYEPNVVVIFWDKWEYAAGEEFKPIRIDVQMQKKQEPDEIMTEEFLDEIGYTSQTEYTEENFKGEKKDYTVNPPYGRAIEKRTNGMTVLAWNTDGPNCTYFGDPLEGAMTFVVEKDAGTRKAFNGYVYSQDDIRRILKLTS